MTLQSRKYDNIWGVGDITNLSITKTWWSGFHQMHAVRANLVRAFKGLAPNAPYTGYTKAPLYIGTGNLTYFEKTYKGPGFWNLRGSTSSFMGSRLFGHLAGLSKKTLKLQMGKSQGPPYGMFHPYGKYYKGKPISRQEGSDALMRQS